MTKETFSLANQIQKDIEELRGNLLKLHSFKGSLSLVDNSSLSNVLIPNAVRDRAVEVVEDEYRRRIRELENQFDTL